MFKKPYYTKLIVALFVVFCVVGFSVMSVKNAGAQNESYSNKTTDDEAEEEVYYDPSDYQQWKDNFKETPVEEMAFRQNKKGCAQKMAFSTIVVKLYREGKDVSQLEGSPILGDYIKEQYALIEEKGLLQAQKDMMEDYRECIKNAEAEEDPGKEYDLNMRYGACDELNTILMGTVDGIKKRQSMETVINRYSRKFPDLSETSYGKVEDPVPFLIGELYKLAEESEGMSEKEKVESLYERASQLTLTCTM